MRIRERWKFLVRTPNVLRNLLFFRRYDFDFDLMSIHLEKMSLRKRLNLIKFGFNLLYRRIYPWSWPIHMQIEITNYCNLKCPVCPTGVKALSRPPIAMNPKFFESLMEEVGPYLLTLALFAWGEPLIHPQLCEILRITSKHNIATIISTNGQNLDDHKVLEALILYPPTYLIVAIDGLTDESNSKFRVGAHLEPILRGVHRLAEMKRQNGSVRPVLHMRYLVMKHNQHEYPYVKDFAKKNMFDLLTIRTLSTIDSPEIPYSELIPDVEVFRAYEFKNNQKIQRNDFVCLNAFSYPTVLSDGHIVSCEQDFSARQSYGMLSNDVSFKDIWFSKRASRIRKTIRDTPSCYSFCKNCPFRDRPVSSCSIQAFELHR